MSLESDPRFPRAAKHEEPARFPHFAPMPLNLDC